MKSKSDQIILVQLAFSTAFSALALATAFMPMHKAPKHARHEEEME
jgi:hypothetical protein